MERRSLGRRLAGGAAIGAVEGVLVWAFIRVLSSAGNTTISGWAVPVAAWFARQHWPAGLLACLVIGVSLGISAVLLAFVLRLDPDELAEQAIRWTAAVFRANAKVVVVVLFVLSVLGMLGTVGGCLGFAVALLSFIALPIFLLRRDTLQMPAAEYAPDVVGPGCGPIVVALLLSFVTGIVGSGVTWATEHLYAIAATPVSLLWSLVNSFIPLVAAILLVDETTDVGGAASSIASWRVLSGWVLASARMTIYMQILIMAAVLLAIAVMGQGEAFAGWMVAGPMMMMFPLLIGGGCLITGRFIVLALPRQPPPPSPPPVPDLEIPLEPIAPEVKAQGLPLDNEQP